MRLGLERDDRLGPTRRDLRPERTVQGLHFAWVTTPDVAWRLRLVLSWGGIRGTFSTGCAAADVPGPTASPLPAQAPWRHGTVNGSGECLRLAWSAVFARGTLRL